MTVPSGAARLPRDAAGGAGAAARAGPGATAGRVLGGQPGVQAGGHGALGGQGVFQGRDAPRGGQGVALVKQFLTRAASASWRRVYLRRLPAVRCGRTT
jgi:hypothetical protein